MAKGLGDKLVLAMSFLPGRRAGSPNELRIQTER